MENFIRDQSWIWNGWGGWEGRIEYTEEEIATEAKFKSSCEWYTTNYELL